MYKLITRCKNVLRIQHKISHQPFGAIFTSGLFILHLINTPHMCNIHSNVSLLRPISQAAVGKWQNQAQIHIHKNQGYLTTVPVSPRHPKANCPFNMWYCEYYKFYKLYSLKQKCFKFHWKTIVLSSLFVIFSLLSWKGVGMMIK